MKFNRTVAVFSLAAAFFAPAVSFADEQPLVSELHAYQVVLDEAGNEEFASADRVDPGALIEYRLSYKNVSDAPLSALIVNGQVPAEAHFVSHQDEVGQKSVLEARTSDLDWAVPPLTRMVRGDDGVLRAETVDPKEYSNVRWRLADPLSAGDAVEAIYRVRVNR